MKFSKFYFGVDYYPEHWPEERWAEDVKLMKKAGFNIVRLAEFAWGKMEPSDNNFDFDWLDRAIELLASHNIGVVLGTPTASPPPWLMSKQEDLFLVKSNGSRLKYGNRRGYCPNNSLYHKHTKRIVEKMAEGYKQSKSVIGWQIDNEFGNRCYCDICKEKFHEWLKVKHKSIDELNSKWGTTFWGHIYSDWSEIPVPMQFGDMPMDSSPNPGLGLDYARFMSDSYVAYQRIQAKILRDICPNHFVTHNFMGFKYPFINYFDLSNDLDFVSWDNYCRMQWTMDSDIDPSFTSLNHDAMRGLKKKNFWMMEQQSGPGGWEIVSSSTKPGELRLWAYQSIAHGADAIVFFRWRTCRFGTEEYWHGVLDHHGIPGRRYDEIAKMGSEIEKIGDQIIGTICKSEVAIVQSYDSRFAFQIQKVNPKFQYEKHFHDFYKGFYKQNIGVDVISEKDDLSSYKLVVVPTMYVLSDETLSNLEAFAEAGGIVVFTGLTGVKDQFNAIVNMRLPGLAAKMSGVEVEEYVSMGMYEENKVQYTHPDLEFEAQVPVWAEVLTPKSATSFAAYSEDFISNKPAATINSFGKGHVIYLGALGDDKVYEEIVLWLIEMIGTNSPVTVPDGIEVTERWKGDQRLLFVLNHTERVHEIEFATRYKDLISGKEMKRTTIIPREVLVLIDIK